VSLSFYVNFGRNRSGHVSRRNLTMLR